MDAIEFIDKYSTYLDEISLVIKPEFQFIIDELNLIEPHDLVTPESFFINDYHAKGFVWNMFIRRVKQN